MTLYHMTVALLCPPGQVILGRKRAKIGKGLYNGAGGKVEEGESIDEATVREVKQELGVTVQPMYLHRSAIVYAHHYDNAGEPFVCKIFVSKFFTWDGTPRDSDELYDVQAFPRRELPLNEMLAGDAFWVPQALTGIPFQCEVHHRRGSRALDAARTKRIQTLSKEEINSSWRKP